MEVQQPIFDAQSEDRSGWTLTFKETGAQVEFETMDQLSFYVERASALARHDGRKLGTLSVKQRPDGELFDQFIARVRDKQWLINELEFLARRGEQGATDIELREELGLRTNQQLAAIHVAIGKNIRAVGLRSSDVILTRVKSQPSGDHREICRIYRLTPTMLERWAQSRKGIK